MYLIENAFRNVVRNKGRNILIGAIILVIIATTVISLMISETANGVIDEYKSRFSTEVSITPDMEKVREEAMVSQSEGENGRFRIEMPTIDANEYIEFGKSEYLSSSVYTAQTGINSEQLTAIDADKGAGSGGGGMRIGGPGGGDNGLQMPEYYFKLIGDEMSEFDEGTRELTEESKFPENSDECLVSEELAELNGIKIGDTLSFSGSLYQIGEADEATGTPAMTTEAISYELKVIGIYYDMNDAYGEQGIENAYNNRQNEILTTYETVQAEYTPEFMGMNITARYFLEKPAYLEKFEAEVRKKGLPDTFSVSTDEATYERIVGPVEGLKNISLTFMLVVIILGAIIIALLSSIAIRERKYEIGVLRAMGMKKKKVAFGLFTEMVIVTSVCLIIGLGAGVLAAQPVTDTLLAGQIAADEAATENIQGGPGTQAGRPGGNMGGGFGGMMIRGGVPSGSDAEPLNELTVALDLKIILMIIGIALALATVATLISILRITKYEPINILMERN